MPISQVLFSQNNRHYLDAFNKAFPLCFTLPRWIKDFIIFFRGTSEVGEEGLIREFILFFSEIIILYKFLGVFLHWIIRYLLCCSGRKETVTESSMCCTEFNRNINNKTLAAATMGIWSTLRNVPSLLLVRKYRSLDIWNHEYVSHPGNNFAIKGCRGLCWRRWTGI